MTSIAKRCEWIDTAKGIAIFLVVLGHSVQYYLCKDNNEGHVIWRFIYSFHMPFFFILSGYVIGLKPLVINVKGKAKRLLIPYFMWALVNFFAVSIIDGVELSKIWDYIYTPSKGGLWYLWALFFIYTIHAIIACLVQNKYMRIFAFISLATLLFFISNIINGHFGFSEISKYFPYYVIGCYLGRMSFLQEGPNIKHGMIILLGGMGTLFIALFGINHICILSSIYKFILALTFSMVFLVLARSISSSCIFYPPYICLQNKH